MYAGCTKSNKSIFKIILPLTQVSGMVVFKQGGINNDTFCLLLFGKRTFPKLIIYLKIDL